ncbi:MAG: cytochrome c oxidase assembly protein [Anaerolineales bacterium]
MLLHHDVEGIGWTWEPSVLAGIALLTLGYFFIGRQLRHRYPGRRWSGWQRFAFHAGTALVFIGLASPLDALGDHYLFSAHMVQHLLFLLAAPLLWLLGVPSWAANTIFPGGRTGRWIEALTRPAVAGALWVGVMWLWHAPQFYDAALEHEGLHILEHLSFLAVSTLGWWPVFGPTPSEIRDEPNLSQAIYLFFVTLSCTALAAILTLSPTILYSFYAESPRLLGWTPLFDQQLGGLLMWLPGDMVLMGAAISVLIRWMNHQPQSFRQQPLVHSEV